MLDVIVVGGGIAGLTAAYRLRHKEILLLEKEPVPSGRTVSRKLGEYVYNAGAQVIMGNTSPAARLADELGVKRTLISKSKVPLFFKGGLYSARTQPGLLLKLPLSLGDRLRFGLSALRIKLKFGTLVGKLFDPADPKVIELNRSTVAEFIGPASPDIRALWNALATIADGEGLEATTPYHPVMIMMQFLDDEYAVDGGTHQLTLALHGTLGDRAKLGIDVERVRATPEGVEVDFVQNGATETLRAARCVMAVPAPIVLETLETLPDAKRKALAQIDYASQTSAAFLLSGPSERRLGQGVWRVPVVGHRACAVTDPTFMYPREFKEQTGQGMLRIYTSDLTSKELMQRPKEEAIGLLRADLNSMFPGIDNEILDADVAHWRYANPKWRPGHNDIYPLLQSPTGRIHYCGDYTSAGYLNGCVLSAYRVAEELASL